MKPSLRLHFSRFIDRHYHPAYQPDEQAWELFERLQSHGHKALTAAEADSIRPLIEAQENKEITIKETISFMGDCWAQGWGWARPLIAAIHDELEPHHYDAAGNRVAEDWVDEHYLNALLKIDLACGSSWFEMELLEAKIPRVAASYEAKVRQMLTLDERPTFLTYLLSYTGLPQDRKARYISSWLALNP